MLTSSAVLGGQPSAAALLGGAAGGRAVRAAAPGGPVVIECSSRPQKKATAHHMKTRPRKTQPWDVNRKPTVYAPLPPLPPDWTLVPDDSAVQVAGTPSAAQAPPTTSPPN